MVPGKRNHFLKNESIDSRGEKIEINNLPYLKGTYNITYNYVQIITRLWKNK